MQNGQVILRLRVIRLVGSENRMTDVVTIIAGPFAVTVRVADSEWAVLTLDSVMEQILFQAKFDNASCQCNEINGRKRVDFSPDLSMLIEGYWFDRFLDRKLVDARLSKEKVTTELCEISYPSTSGITTQLDVLQDTDPETPAKIASPRQKVPKTVAKVSSGPVDIALEWINRDFLQVTPTIPINRITYQPHEQTRLKWSPDLTLMKGRSNPKVDLTSVLTAVEFSQSLDKYYIL
jgi:hypothetical protein